MKTKIKIVHWTPRILCILAILFISLFALDAFDPKLTVWEQILGFLMHMIPSFILLAFLLIAWKWERTGGFVFITIGLITSPLVFTHNYNMNESVWMSLGIIGIITLPFILVGGLFLLSHHLKKKMETKKNPPAA